LARLEFASMLKDLELNIIDMKDEEEVIKCLQAKKMDVSAVMWVVNSSEDAEDFNSIRKLKSKEVCKSLPIVVISKFTDKKHIIKAVESGAAEFIAKPYDQAVVRKKIFKILDIPVESDKDKMAEEDFITFNFPEMFSREMKGASRGGYSLTLALVSIQDPAQDPMAYRSISDIAYYFSKVLKIKLRETDSVFRYRSNQLVLLLPFTAKSGAEQVEKKIEELYYTHSVIKAKDKGYKPVIASVTFPDDGRIKEKLLEKLEKAISDSINIL
jgi:CheY-like chemotaxis protein